MPTDKTLISITPSRRQLEFQQLEFYAFVHFSMNTFTDKEWGDGTEQPAWFHPEKLNANQWVSAVKAAGMKGLILTCKHHDGFCLWPTAYTTHSVAYSPYQNGKGDVVKEVSEACRKQGIRFGIYLSPWDRNCKSYGKGKEYDDFYIGQLTELLTNYGEIFSVWFDGACGEGVNGKKQQYDWERYYEVIRRLQPKACISVCGPDIRWCGNEAGQTRESEWSVVPARTADTEKIKENSQQADNAEFRGRTIKASDRDLGSREIVKEETEFIWYPAEVNTSIRPGWFYHADEDDKVRSLEELLHIYMGSVGGNATFLLNIPPTPMGLFHENDVKRLQEMGDFLSKAFQKNLLAEATLSYQTVSAELKYDVKKVSDTKAVFGNIEAVRTDDYETSFLVPEGTKETVIEIEFPQETTISYLVLKENIMFSQRIERFEIQIEKEGVPETIFYGSVVGYQKIIPLQGLTTKKVWIKLTDVRVAPVLAFLGVY